MHFPQPITNPFAELQISLAVQVPTVHVAYAGVDFIKRSTSSKKTELAAKISIRFMDGTLSISERNLTVNIGKTRELLI